MSMIPVLLVRRGFQHGNGISTDKLTQQKLTLTIVWIVISALENTALGNAYYVSVQVGFHVSPSILIYRAC